MDRMELYNQHNETIEKLKTTLTTNAINELKKYDSPKDKFECICDVLKLYAKYGLEASNEPLFHYSETSIQSTYVNTIQYIASLISKDNLLNDKHLCFGLSKLVSPNGNSTNPYGGMEDWADICIGALNTRPKDPKTGFNRLIESLNRGLENITFGNHYMLECSFVPLFKSYVEYKYLNEETSEAAIHKLKQQFKESTQANKQKDLELEDQQQLIDKQRLQIIDLQTHLQESKSANDYLKQRLFEEMKATCSDDYDFVKMKKSRSILHREFRMMYRIFAKNLQHAYPIVDVVDASDIPMAIPVVLEK